MAVSLADGIKNVGSGDAFKSPPAAVNGLTSFGLQVGEDAAASITESWGDAQANLSTAISVSQSKVTLIGIKAKSEGREPTDEELEEACGPLSFLANAGNAINNALGGIFDQVGEFASEFGQSIGAFAAELNGLIADVANAVDEIAQEIAEAALSAFEAVNAVAIQALEAVEGAINAAVGFVNGAIAKAEELINSAIDELLAFADSLNFASLFSLDCQKEAVENALDGDKIADADEVDRVIGPTPTTKPKNEGATFPPTDQDALPDEPPGYWTADDNRLTFLSFAELEGRRFARLPPFGTPVARKPNGEVNYFVARANDTGRIYLAVTGQILEGARTGDREWALLTLDEAAARGVTISPSLRADDNKKVPVPSPKGAEEIITAPTLERPQTTFETPETKPPSPSLNVLIERYRTAARALDAGRLRVPIISRTERAALERAARDAFQDLRIAALAEGKTIDELPIFGRNFDELPAPLNDPRGADAAKPKTSASAPTVQKEIDSIKADIARYNRLNQEQIREINRQKLSIFRSGPEFAAEVQATDRKTAEVKALGREINSRIARASPEVKKGVGISQVEPVKTGFF